LKPAAVTALYRVFVALMTVAVAWVIADVIPQFSSVPSDLEDRFGATYLNLIFAAYASIIAVFVVWKVGKRADGRALSLLMAFFSLHLALSVTPAGQADPRERVALVIVLSMAFVAAIRFWMFFPHIMQEEEVRALATRREIRSRFDRFNRWTARVVATVLRSATARLLFLAAVAVFSYELTSPSTYQYNLYARDSLVPDNPLIHVAGLPAVLLTVIFAWTAFRLAHRDERRRMLWIIFGQITIGVWVTMAVLLAWLQGATGSAPLTAAAGFVGRTYHPVTTFVNLTGFAAAIFYSGAFDLRPLINRTTVYGAVLVVLTFVFAGVEEVVQSQVAGRLGLPEGLGTWIGAAAVAGAMGPVKTRLDKVVKGAGERVPPPAPDLPSDTGAS
jgi:hypothetical protein